MCRCFDSLLLRGVLCMRSNCTEIRGITIFLLFSLGVLQWNSSINFEPATSLELLNTNFFFISYSSLLLHKLIVTKYSCFCTKSVDQYIAGMTTVVIEHGYFQRAFYWAFYWMVQYGPIWGYYTVDAPKWWLADGVFADFSWRVLVCWTRCDFTIDSLRKTLSFRGEQCFLRHFQIVVAPSYSALDLQSRLFVPIYIFWLWTRKCWVQ